MIPEKVKNFIGICREKLTNDKIMKEHKNVIWNEVSVILREMENGLNDFEKLINELYRIITGVDVCSGKRENMNFDTAEWIRGRNIVYCVIKRIAVYRGGLNELQIKFPHESRISSFNKRLAYCEQDLLSAYNFMGFLDLF